jgi:predicted SnoaL-like aldol condensation-catalyzing enzyme
VSVGLLQFCNGLFFFKPKISIMTNQELVKQAIIAVFVDRDITAFDRYFSEDYIQHNPYLPNGTAALKQFLPTLSKDFNYEPGEITSSGDLVMIHGRYTDWNGKTMVAVDIFRVKESKVAEHWDVMQEEVPADKSANGNPMFPIS